MTELIKFILHSDVGSVINNWAILIFRVLLSLELFRVHGMKKFRAKNGQIEKIPNPFHLPEKLNGLLATFSDTVVPLLVTMGICTRLAVMPTIGVTAIGYFIVHKNDSPEIRDVPYIYTICFLLLLVTGPGTFSVDQYLFNALRNY
ncbi:MAG: DoxX family protein [Mucilaginibacter sp.]|jgi:putative oxidoreductase|uniref:DoxX family protein n=1 Tax=Mucilaginibacter sp. TaxID=1882438 RepID=UPI00356A304E